MALSEDSRTLLQLLLGRGKSYGDIAGLLGIDESEVRERAHRALTEINGDDPDRNVPLTDYLLGQADPIARADVARRLAEDGAAAETAADLADQLSLLVPGATLPRGASKSPAPRTRTTGTGGAPKRARRSTPSPSGERESATGERAAGNLTAPQRRLIAILIFVALLIVVAILLIADPFGGSDDSPETPTPNADNAGAVMKPANGEEGSGKVQFGRVDENFAANLQFNGLTPSTKNDSYILWMNGSVGAFPLTELAIDDTGNYSNTLVLPPETLCSISGGLFTDLTLTRIDDAEGKRIVRDTEKALKGNQQQLPDVRGTQVFAGPVALEPALRDDVNQQCQTPAANQ